MTRKVVSIRQGVLSRGLSLGLWGAFLVTGVQGEEEGVDPDLLSQLASEVFAERKQAQAEFLKWVGEKKERQVALRRVYGSETDPEIRMRLKEILKEVFSGVRLGYLGVYFQMEPFETIEGEQISVMRVSKVVEDTGASRGGILRDDLLAEIGDWKVDRNQSLAEIKWSIQQLPVGEKVLVKLYRKGKPMTLRLRIMAHPDEDILTPEERENAFQEWFERLGAR